MMLSARNEAMIECEAMTRPPGQTGNESQRSRGKLSRKEKQSSSEVSRGKHGGKTQVATLWRGPCATSNGIFLS